MHTHRWAQKCYLETLALNATRKNCNRQTDRQKAMHKSPLSIGTGGLKNEKCKIARQINMLNAES